MENGANSSFVSQVSDENVPIEKLLQRPADQLSSPRHPAITHPLDIFSPRRNSAGFCFGDKASLDALSEGMKATKAPQTINALMPTDVAPMVERAKQGFRVWRDTSVSARSAILRKAADGLENDRDRILAILAQEAGKTIDDGIAELREAVDFLRYYADEAERVCVSYPLPGPVGEENIYSVTGRGVWVAIAPWNFPLAIFLG